MEHVNSLHCARPRQEPRRGVHMDPLGNEGLTDWQDSVWRAVIGSAAVWRHWGTRPRDHQPQPCTFVFRSQHTAYIHTQELATQYVLQQTAARTSTTTPTTTISNEQRIAAATLKRPAPLSILLLLSNAELLD